MNEKQLETTVFGGGCFWCTEAVFQSLKGVISVMPGYMGGETARPTYEQISNGDTGHAECIRITFDPQVISFTDLLSVFFNTHDPTTTNRQGADIGTQYRSVIFYTTDEQKRVAEELIAELTTAKAYENRIVTEVKPLGEFYEAEDYHKDYYKNNSSQAYCQLVIAPKLEKLQKRFAQLLV
jgi:peptide-methionine (S)-S-oxide reductase